MMLSAAMMLKHLNLNKYANRISNAVYRTIEQGDVKTRDMGGNSTTTDFTKAIISIL